MARYELNEMDGGWLDTTKPCGPDGGLPEPGTPEDEQLFADADEFEVVTYMNEMESRIATLEGEAKAARNRHCGWKMGDGGCHLGRDNFCDFCLLHIEVTQLRDPEPTEDTTRLATLEGELADKERARARWELRAAYLVVEAADECWTAETLGEEPTEEGSRWICRLDELIAVDWPHATPTEEP